VLQTQPPVVNSNPLRRSPLTEHSPITLLPEELLEGGFRGPVGVRTRGAILADLAATAGDEPACDRLREELGEHDARRNPFTKEGDINPEWSRSMSKGNREVLALMSTLAGPDPDDDTASLLRRGATCFRGAPTGHVLRNRLTSMRKPRFWRCQWPVCPKSCCPGSVEGHRYADYRDVIEPAVSDLADPQFWLVIPSIELPDESSAKNLVEKAASYVGRQSGGIRFGSWMSRRDGRHHPIIAGTEWLGEVSVATGGVVAFNTIGTRGAHIFIKVSDATTTGFPNGAGRGQRRRVPPGVDGAALV